MLSNADFHVKNLLTGFLEDIDEKGFGIETKIKKLRQKTIARPMKPMNEEEMNLAWSKSKSKAKTKTKKEKEKKQKNNPPPEKLITIDEEEVQNNKNTINVSNTNTIKKENSIPNIEKDIYAKFNRYYNSHPIDLEGIKKKAKKRFNTKKKIDGSIANGITHKE